MSADLWEALLVNFLFWSGVAIGAVVFAALLELTDAAWALPLRTTAQRFRRFLPISFAHTQLVRRMHIIFRNAAMMGLAAITHDNVANP